MTSTHGMTFIGMVFTMMIILLLGLLIMRIAPVYIKYYEVSHAISVLHTLPASEFSADQTANVMFLRQKAVDQLEINQLTFIHPEQIQIVSLPDHHYQITITYQEKIPLIANISLLFEFRRSDEVVISHDG